MDNSKHCLAEIEYILFKYLLGVEIFQEKNVYGKSKNNFFIQPQFVAAQSIPYVRLV